MREARVGKQAEGKATRGGNLSAGQAPCPQQARFHSNALMPTAMKHCLLTTLVAGLLGQSGSDTQPA